MARKRLLIAALIVGGLLSAAGIADAVIPDAGGVYHACMLKNTGTIRLIDSSLSPSSLLSHCTSLETEISWNKQGVPGTNGTNGLSPTVAQLPAGDPNCAAGGASITDAAGNTAYVCSGQNGSDGEDFAGTFTSPNGQYKLEVTDTGITLQGPGGKVKLDGPNTQIEAAAQLQLKGGATAKLESSGIAEIRGGFVQLNGCARQLVGVGNQVLVDPSTGFGQILPPGSPTVCAG
jgi:hypothetical protein